MSVSQVKKKFEEMSQYLNRDAEGQKRLKELKDAVNVLRTSLATAVEEKQRADAIKDQARARADKAVAELDALLVEVQSLRATIESLRGENARLIADMTNATDPDQEKDFNLPEDTPGRLLADLRRAIPRCPYYAHNSKVNGLAGKLYLDDFFTTVTYKEVWAFGATVFLLSLLAHGDIAGSAGLLVSMRGNAIGNLKMIDAIFQKDRHKKMFAEWFQDNMYNEKMLSLEANVSSRFRRQMAQQFKYAKGTDYDDGLESEGIFGSDED
jgi:hypothetical protein